MKLRFVGPLFDLKGPRRQRTRLTGHAEALASSASDSDQPPRFQQHIPLSAWREVGKKNNFTKEIKEDMTRKSLLAAVILAVMFCAGFLARTTVTPNVDQPSEYFGFVVAT